jgi:hypothetical protein
MRSGRASSARFAAQPMCRDRSISGTRLLTALEAPWTWRGLAIIFVEENGLGRPASRRGQPQTHP